MFYPELSPALQIHKWTSWKSSEADRESIWSKEQCALASREEADRHAGYDVQLTTGAGQNEHLLLPHISPSHTDEIRT